MQQVVQNIRSGALSVIEAPDPIARPGQVLIANAASVISSGTEKMVMDLAKKSLLGKARERPDHVRRVIEKVRQEGLWNTINAVRTKLDEPMTMGYSSAGIVIGCGAGVQEFQVGDRVASNGPHAGIVSVPKNLCAAVPENVPLEQAAFAVMGSIALQGVRLADVRLGETVFVIGLGLLGQIAVALLRAAGCRVIGVDPDAARCELAVTMGAELARPGLRAADIESRTGGLGADAVLITASTQSNGPIELAADAVRQKGRVVLVGVIGLNVPRRPFYFKEASFAVSCSYGPGRYDPNYEDRGIDYPAAYVRWTEQRNIASILELLSQGKLDFSPLISHRVAIDRAEEAYEIINTGEPHLGIVLQYPEVEPNRLTRRLDLKAAPAGSGTLGVSSLGAGNFARMVLLPAIGKHTQLRPRMLCSAGGLSAKHTGENLGFEVATTDENEIYRDEQTQAVFILTRHDLHARQVLETIRAGKHCFVEKPLAITSDEIDEIHQALASMDQPPLLMIGFNRRFSEAARQVRSFISDLAEPVAVSIRFNAGAIPKEHWTQHDEEGGGRIIGEACHAIDLATYLTGSLPVRVYAEAIGGPDAPTIRDDQTFITLRHANGSISNIAYLAGGDRAMPKERIEVIGGGRMAVIEDFRQVITARGGKVVKANTSRDGKGHAEEIDAFAAAMLKGGANPIPWEELRAVSLASILAVQSLREGIPFEIPHA